MARETAIGKGVKAVLGCFVAIGLLLFVTLGGCVAMLGLVASSSDSSPSTSSPRPAPASTSQDPGAEAADEPPAAPTRPPTSPAPPTTPKEPPLVEVRAVDVYYTYEQNEVNGDELLKGKWGIVTGRVRMVGKDVLGTPYVMFESRDPIFGVQCMFGSQHSAELAQLSPGDFVRIAGQCQGKFGNVVFGECYFAEEPPSEAELKAQQRAELRAKRQREAELRAAQDELKWRTWTSGQHTLHAKFVGQIGSTVKLEKEDGTVIDVPAERLSGEDRQWITERGWEQD